MAEPRKASRSNSGVSVTLTVRVVPRSSKISFTQEGPTQYKIRLTSPPVDNAANSQLIEVLSKKLSVAPRCIQITRGEKARIKHVMIDGLDAETVSRLLLST